MDWAIAEADWAIGLGKRLGNPEGPLGNPLGNRLPNHRPQLRNPLDSAAEPPGTRAANVGGELMAGTGNGHRMQLQPPPRLPNRMVQLGNRLPNRLGNGVPTLGNVLPNPLPNQTH